MELHLEKIIPEHFADNSRVWIYQADRPFLDSQIIEVEEQLQNFYTQWQSHGTPVKGWAKCIYKQFIVVLADVAHMGIGGCSTDSMVRIIKSFERQYGIVLFDRLTLTFLINEKVEPMPMQQINYALQKGFIETDSLLFNNLVETKRQLINEWLVPLNKSWIWNRIVNLDT
jgi:hypothetical protein